MHLGYHRRSGAKGHRWDRLPTAFVAAIVSVVALPASAADITLGRWCDKVNAFIPQADRVLTILIKDNGAVVAHSLFRDGSSGERALIEQRGDIFRVEDSPNGDSYRIVASTGDLQIFDRDGLIRSATRLENIVQQGDCLP